MFAGPLNVKWFGAKGDDVGDTSPIQRGLNVAAWNESLLPRLTMIAMSRISRRAVLLVHQRSAPAELEAPPLVQCDPALVCPMRSTVARPIGASPC